MNKIHNRSLHPFQLISDGESVYVHRGLVFDVDNAGAFDVEFATLDLRYQLPETAFSQGADIYVKVEYDNPAGVSVNESSRVLSAKLIQGASVPGGIKIGNITDGTINQNIRSDIYVYIPGTSNA